MNIHEHQAKSLLRDYGVNVPAGFPAFTVEEAVSAAEKLNGAVTVVKAQIHAGGRGKGNFKNVDNYSGGGVKVVKSIDEVKDVAEKKRPKQKITAGILKPNPRQFQNTKLQVVSTKY